MVARVVGDDYFVCAVRLALDAKNRFGGAVRAFGDEELSRLADLPYLRDLHLSEVPLSDSTMRKLGQLNRLEKLVLSNTQVTEASLPTISRLGRLKSLWIEWYRSKAPPTMDAEVVIRSLVGLRNLEELHLGMPLTDAAAPLLLDFPKLDWLAVDASQLTDEGLKSIGKLTTLTQLSLGRGAFTDEGLQHLQGLKNLTDLSLAFTPITDAGLAHLVPLQQLKILSIQGTNVTDEGMQYVAQLPNLRMLCLSWTGVTNAAFKHLETLPLEEIIASRTEMTQDEMDRFFNRPLPNEVQAAPANPAAAQHDQN